MLSDDDPLTGRRQLTSWKEIAQFLGRSVRTVQEWEKREGLPVHRHRHQRRDSVYAYSDEVETWWQQHEAAPPALLPAEVSALEMPAPTHAPRRRTLLGAAAVALIILTSSPGARIDTRQSIGGAPIEIDGPLDGQLTFVRIADLNGDGHDDLLLNASEAREIYLVLSGAPALRGGRAADVAAVTITGARGSGLYISQVGDFNGDTLNDVVVTVRLGQPDDFSGSGSSYILWGRRTWPASLSVPDQADVTIAVRRAPDATMYGCLRGPNNDLNGDGVADIWLGAFEYGDGDRKSAGSVFVIYGKRDWPRALEVAAAADVTFRGTRMGEGLGGPCVFDRHNGTPGGRVAILANEDRLWNLLGGAGRLYVFAAEGGWPRSVDATAAQFHINAPHRESAWNVQSGELNGDGHADVVGAINRAADVTRTGEVFIWFGNRERRGALQADSADVTIRGVRGGRLGEGLRVEDLDADGRADLIIAEPGNGQLHVVYGRPDWPAQGTLASLGGVTLMRAEAEAGRSQWELALGDLDADLLPDLVAVSHAANQGGGRASIIKPYVPVRLEIRPLFDPNPIILPNGVLVARVYGWSASARDRIDPATVRLAGALPTRHTVEDFDGDGFEDLQLYFETALMRVHHDTTRIAVRGRTLGGLPIGGTDAVVIVSGTEAERDQF